MSTKQPGDSQQTSLSPEDEQKQIQDLVNSFTKRTEAILGALSMGATFVDIEEYLDYLDGTEHRIGNQDPG